MKFTKKLTKFISVLCAVAIIPSLYCTSPVYAGESTAYYESYIKAEDLGNYDFEVEAHEIPSNEVLPIIDKSYFPVTVAHFQSEVDNTAPSALYKASGVTKVDVVFALGRLNQLDTFQAYIPTFTSKLESASNHIDANVEQVKTEGVDLQNAFNWTTDVSSSIGSITITDSGRTVDMRGNRRRPGKNAMWVLSDKQLLKQEFSFDYTLSYGDSFSGAGVLLNVGKYGNQIKGYAITFNNSRGTFSPRGGASIVRITYDIGQNTTQFGAQNVQKIKDLRISQNGRLTIETGRDYIKVSGGGLPSPVEVNLPEHFGYGLGFFSEHYSHNCSRIGEFSLRNMALKITSAKSLGEALSDVSWRDEAMRFVIHATDVVPVEMEPGHESDYQYTITKLLNANCYLINIGNDINEEQLNALVKTLGTMDGESKGAFFQSDPVNKSLDDSCDWIIEKAKNFMKPEDWYLVNTEIIWDTIYDDQEHDLPLNFGEHDGTKNQDISDITLAEAWGVGLTHLYKDEKIFAEKWRYRHFNNYFDNSPVRESFHNIWIEDPVEIFPNPGLYRVNYKRRDNPLHPNVSLTDAFDSYRYWSTDYDRKESSGN